MVLPELDQLFQVNVDLPKDFADVVALRIDSTLDQNSSDEAWALDNLQVLQGFEDAGAIGAYGAGLVDVSESSQLGSLIEVDASPSTSLFGVPTVQRTSVLTTSLSLIVRETNTAPTSADFTVAIQEDSPFTFSLAQFEQGFSDLEFDSLQMVRLQFNDASLLGSFTLDGQVLSDGAEIPANDLNRLIYTPDSNVNSYYWGPASLSFQVSDGVDWSASSNSVTIAVGAEADAPILDTVPLPQLLPIVEDTASSNHRQYRC